MHISAMNYAKLFFDTYFTKDDTPVIVDVGSQDVNGSLRIVAPPNCRYIGLDFAPGKGVDLILEDPYQFPLEDGVADAVVSSSCLEHSQMFWLTVLEAFRILKPGGLLYINVPSNGSYHRYPTDNWRFYPDAGIALNTWLKRSGHNSTLLESFIGRQDRDQWNDFVAVFLKDKTFSAKFSGRICQSAPNLTNVHIDDSTDPINFMEPNQDMRRMNYLLTNLKRLGQALGEI
jgi:SAM-dependent methyltransferase